MPTDDVVCDKRVPTEHWVLDESLFLSRNGRKESADMCDPRAPKLWAVFLLMLLRGLFMRVSFLWILKL